MNTEKFKFIKYINIDFYERWAIIENQNRDILTVSFIEYNMDDLIFSEGDVFEAELGIRFIMKPKKVSNQKKQYIQTKDNNPCIEAIVKVKKVISEYEILASSNIIEENIVLKFEDNNIFRENDKIQVYGELSIRNETLGFGGF